LNYWALKCANQHEYLATSQSGICPECDEGPAEQGQMLMFPRFGYTTAAWAPPKSPGRRLDRIGEVVVVALDGIARGDATKRIEDYADIRGLTASYLESIPRSSRLRRHFAAGRGMRNRFFATESWQLAKLQICCSSTGIDRSTILLVTLWGERLSSLELNCLNWTAVSWRWISRARRRRERASCYTMQLRAAQVIALN